MKLLLVGEKKYITTSIKKEEAEKVMLNPLLIKQSDDENAEVVSFQFKEGYNYCTTYGATLGGVSEKDETIYLELPDGMENLDIINAMENIRLLENNIGDFVAAYDVKMANIERETVRVL